MPNGRHPLCGNCAHIPCVLWEVALGQNSALSVGDKEYQLGSEDQWLLKLSTIWLWVTESCGVDASIDSCIGHWPYHSSLRKKWKEDQGNQGKPRTRI